MTAIHAIGELAQAVLAPGGIRTRPEPDCYLCESPAMPLYEDLVDGLFGAPGVWNLVRCPNPKCGLVWLDPMPIEEDLGAAYANYYTHGDSVTQGTWLASVMRRRGSVLRSLLNPARQEKESLFLMDLDKIAPGRLLDVGCGDGTRIAQLRRLGWEVRGQDLDPAAIRHAREKLSLDSFLGPLEDAPFPENSFDCVTLSHVIEHVADPVQFLELSRRFLKPGGRVVVITPNVESFAHQYFGRLWRGLEPPRHLHLFSPRTLTRVAGAAGFSAISSLRTSVGNAQIFAHGSLAIKNGAPGARPFQMAAREAYTLGVLYRSFFQHLKNADSGEEIIMHARR